MNIQIISNVSLSSLITHVYIGFLWFCSHFTSALSEGILESWALSLESWALISWDSTFLLNLFTWPQTSCCQAAIWRLITSSDSSWLWFESFSPSTFQQELAHQNEPVISDVDVIIFRYKMLFCFWLMMLTKGHSVHLLLVVLLERVSK